MKTIFNEIRKRVVTISKPLYFPGPQAFSKHSSTLPAQATREIILQLFPLIAF
ncbi:MAG: hypothetical protein JWP78_2111 [Mucilaginibacter sp.]|nr:hypothetical protein [Mucilaginibacter sp.]